LLAILPIASSGQAPGNQAADPVTTVKGFYAFHFKHKFDYSAPGLRLRRRWLDDSLYRLLLAELKKPVKNDEPPDLEGDPFTNSQEYPTSFRVGSSKADGNKTTVEVFFVWKEKGKLVDERRIEVELLKSPGGWKIANIVSGDGDDLLKFLKRTS
jgi:hypothetical protein